MCQEKQHSSGIINDEYRINVTQFIEQQYIDTKKCIVERLTTVFSCQSQEISKPHLFHWQLASMSIS